MLRDIILLNMAARFAEPALLALRLFIGVFLMWGTFDNIASAARMQEFADFLAALNCPYPDFAAKVSVYAQFICGALIALGLLTRIASLVMVVNFLVAVALIAPTPGQDFRTLFPPLVMIFVALYLAARGAGAISVDARITPG